MKASYTLVITILLITLFSYLGISTLQTKSLQNKNLQNQYLYIQANNHKEFLKKYLLSIDLKNIHHLKIDDEVFEIEAFIQNIDSNYKIDIFVKAKKYKIKIYEQLTKE